MRPIKVIPDTIHRNMYRLAWADGIKSQDCYNLSRAHDIFRNYDRYLADMATSERQRGKPLKWRLARQTSPDSSPN